MGFGVSSGRPNLLNRKVASNMALRLDQLPSELLVQIISHCESARTVSNLSLACKRIHDFVEKDGYRVFVQSCFPSFKTPPYWKDAAHGLTTWSRNWDRKAFLARRIEPYKDPHLTSKFAHRERPPRNQTMGYQPIIDSLEEWTGGNWSSRKETVVWGAGAELIVRVRKTGEEAEVAWQADRKPERKTTLDQHHHMYDWIPYKEPGLLDGRDDITTTNILFSARDAVESKHVIVWRASGRLKRIAIDVDGSKIRSVGAYETKNRSVRSATVSQAAKPLLAACLADNAVALYLADSYSDGIKILDEVSAVPPGKPGRTWSSRFLRQDRLAVGRGPSGQPLLIYGIGEAGFSKEPIRKYEAIFGDDETSSGSQNADSSAKSTSIYPIASIAPSSAAGGAEGDIFLSGGYDGNVRLHDLRSPAPATAIFMDFAENSAIYSLLPLGRERFVAGASRYAMIKIFDLRMPGGKVYYSADLDPCTTPTSSAVAGTSACLSGRPCCDYHLQTKTTRGNYNIYIQPPLPHTRRRGDSPVYSLSAPSPFSPTFYAGIENAVVQFDVVSAFDKRPDPVYMPASGQRSVVRWQGGGVGRQSWDVVNKWDPQGEVTNLRLYEQVLGKARMRTQVGLGGGILKMGRKGEMGWDERWV